MSDLDQLTRLRPAVDDPTPDWLTANRQALLDRAAGTPRPRRRTSRRGNLVALAAGIAVLAVIALVTPASSLLVASSKAHYLYVKQGYTSSKGYPLSINEAWYPLDSAAPADFTPKITVNCAPDGPGTTCPPGHTITLLQSGQEYLRQSGPPFDWSYQQFKALPTDTQQLRARFYDLARSQLTVDQRNSDEALNEEVFLLIGGVLTKAVAPQETVTALQQVLLTIPGVAPEQPAKDAIGRSGIGISRRTTIAFGYDSTLVFDPGTHRFLGENQVNPRASGKTPSWVVYSSGLVDHVGDRL